MPKKSTKSSSKRTTDAVSLLKQDHKKKAIGATELRQLGERMKSLRK
jgi:hypothetical protein